MKRISVLALFLLTGVLTACEKEKTNDVKASILGKWRLEKIFDEEYHPINVLVTRDEEIGDPSDSVIFKADNTMLVYEDGFGPFEEEYTIIGDDQIVLEGELYKIVRLTETEFHLHQEEIDRANNEKWVYKIFLIR